MLLKSRPQLSNRSFSTDFDAGAWHMERVTLHGDVPHVYMGNNARYKFPGNFNGNRNYPLDVPNLHPEKDFFYEDRRGSHETWPTDDQLTPDQYLVARNEEIVNDIFDCFAMEINKQSHKDVLEEKARLEKDITELQAQQDIFYLEPHRAWQLHNEIEAKKRAVAYCDTMIEKHENRVASFAHEIENASVDAIEKM